MKIFLLFILYSSTVAQAATRFNINNSLVFDSNKKALDYFSDKTFWTHAYIPTYSVGYKYEKLLEWNPELSYWKRLRKGTVIVTKPKRIFWQASLGKAAWQVVEKGSKGEINSTLTSNVLHLERISYVSKYLALDLSTDFYYYDSLVEGSKTFNLQYSVGAEAKLSYSGPSSEYFTSILFSYDWKRYWGLDSAGLADSADLVSNAGVNSAVIYWVGVGVGKRLNFWGQSGHLELIGRGSVYGKWEYTEDNGEAVKSWEAELSYRQYINLKYWLKANVTQSYHDSITDTSVVSGSGSLGFFF